MFGTMYGINQARIVSLVEGADPDKVVPACPDWTITDVVRHLTGLARDVVSGNVEGYASDAWTDMHVTSRADDSLADVIAEWTAVVSELSTVLDDIESSTLPEFINTNEGPQKRSTFPIAVYGDMLHHEFDLRNALGNRDDRDRPDVVGSGVGHAKALRPGYSSRGLPTLRVVVDGNPIDVGRDEPIAQVSLSAFEAFRGIGGRRTIDEIAGYDWDGERDVFIENFVLTTMSPAATSIGEQ